jgi:AcrR family transcriptional regulator
MRLRILEAAAIAFSRAGYDAVGIREIAAIADTDPAIVIRLFGSKADLFARVAESRFGSEEVFEGPLDTLGARLAGHLMLPLPDTIEITEPDDFLLLLRSAASLTAAPILSAALHRALIEPLGARIGAQEGEMRAALIVAQVLGFATLRFGLGSTAIESADRQRVADRLAGMIQDCIDS